MEYSRINDMEYRGQDIGYRIKDIEYRIFYKI